MIRWNKGLCNNYLEVGGGGGLRVWFGKLVGGAQEKITARERRGWMSNLIHTEEITFSFPFANWKSSGRVNRVQI